MADEKRWKGLTERWVGWWPAAILAGVAFVLGFIGFEMALGSERSYFDVAYLSLQLFTIESGNAAGPSPPVALEIARFMAPFATIYALGRAAAQLLVRQRERRRLQRSKNHVVVVGLGWLGLELVERLVDQGRDVAVVSLEMDDEAIASVKRSGVPVIVGDARDGDILKEAKAEAASHVVVLAGDDEINAEVALSMRAIHEEEGARNTVCLAHIRDPQLCQMLRIDALTRDSTQKFRLEFFNVAEEAAAIMLEENAVFLGDARPAHIGTVGDNDVAAAIVTEAVRTRHRAGIGELRIDMAAAGDLPDLLSLRFPQLTASATIEPIPGPVSPGMVDRLASCETIFVCLDQDTRAIAITLEIAEQLPNVPVVVALGQWAGMASMLSADSRRLITPFLIPERLLDGDLLLAGLGERLARVVHGQYLEEVGGADFSTPSRVPWSVLPEEYRQSNRDQVAHMGEKLRMIDCGLVPQVDWDEAPLELTEAEIEFLAREEHKRFVEERTGAGWELDESLLQSEAEQKKSPFLKPWEELPDLIQALDRTAVELVPILAARAGFRVVRKPGDREQ